MRTAERKAPTSSDDERSAAHGSRVLLVVVGNGDLVTHPLDPGGEATLGRDLDCEVTLEHRKISRRHARVHRSSATPAAIMLEDLGSTNGSRIGGQRIASGASVELHVGDSFRIGPFTVIIAPDAPDAHHTRRTRLDVFDPTRDGVSATVARFAASSINVLIQGETGSGKEVLARTIHELSGRPGPFVGINVAALSEALLESELFGHERGAFTGASRAKAGLLESANRGTVFLDEIGEMTGSLQAKLLRAIERREVYRVGGLAPVALEVRFVAATHRDLEAEATAGRFRSDLLYRLDGISMYVAPLRKRRSAIATLARVFLGEVAAAAGRPVPRLSVGAVAKLVKYHWPGNVRELRAVIERAMLLCETDELLASAILVDAEEPPASAESFLGLARRHQGNVTQIARALGTSRSQVHRLAQRFGIVLEQLRAS